MNVLSLFDGMSCGQIALNRANISYDNYFASEIDKYAITITQKHYPKTIQLGDITKWREWNLPKIDLIIAGSPCQGFSVAGKGLNFDDPRSKLFFVFVEILNHYQPRYFLLENVKMKQEWQDIISEQVGVQPILIDSALVSAQSRKRLYWTNIPNVQQPEDRGIVLRDIIEDGIVDRDKSYCIDANYYKGSNYNNYFVKGRRQIVLGVAIRGRYLENGKTEQRLEIRGDEKSNSLTAIQKDNVIVKTIPHGYMKEEIKERDKYPSLAAQSPDSKYLIQIDSLYPNNAQAGRVYSIEGKSTTLKGEAGGLGAKTGLYEIESNWRKLTPIECERLQTIEDNWTEGVSNTQRYRMLGNGWTIEVIVGIFEKMEHIK